MVRVLVISAKDEGYKAAYTLIKSPFIDEITIADINLADAEHLVTELKAQTQIKITAAKVNTSSRDELLKMLAGHDFAAGALELVASLTSPVQQSGWWQGPGWPEGWKGPGWPQGPGWPEGWQGPAWPEGWQGPGWPEGWKPSELDPKAVGGMICGKIPIASVPNWLAGCACVERSSSSVPPSARPSSASGPPPQRPSWSRGERGDGWGGMPDRGPQVPSWDDPKEMAKVATGFSTDGGTGSEEWRIVAKSISDPPGPVQRSKYLKQLSRLGVPSCWRGLIWCFFGGVLHKMCANKGYYQRIHDEKRKVVLEKAIPDEIKARIAEESKLKYVPAFCSHERFQGERGMQRLARVLTAFMFYTRNSRLDEDIGLIARALLIHMGEEQAFWALVVLTQEIAPIDFFSDSSTRVGAKVDANVVHEIVKRDIGECAHTIEKLSVDFHPIVFRWLLSLFLRSLKFETAMRVWDILFYLGPRAQGKVLLEVALAIIFNARTHHAFPSSATASAAVSSLSQSASSLSPERLIQLLSLPPCKLKSRIIETFRLKFRAGLHTASLYSIPVPFVGAHICLCPSDRPHVCRPAGPHPPEGIVAQVLSNVSAKPAALAKIPTKTRGRLTKPGEQYLF